MSSSVRPRYNSNVHLVERLCPQGLGVGGGVDAELGISVGHGVIGDSGPLLRLAVLATDGDGVEAGERNLLRTRLAETTDDSLHVLLVHKNRGGLGRDFTRKLHGRSIQEELLQSVRKLLSKVEIAKVLDFANERIDLNAELSQVVHLGKTGQGRTVTEEVFLVSEEAD